MKADERPVVSGERGTIADPRRADSLSNRFRARRDKRLRALIVEVAQRKAGPVSIVDLGGRPEYWDRVGRGFLEQHDIRVDCMNYDATELDTTSRADRVRTIVGDACAVDAPDHHYDLVHSNSVIEHVGTFADMMRFAGEARRLAPAYYVQTPYFWFPIDPHYHQMPGFHWLPRPAQAALLQRFRIGHAPRNPDLAVALARVESREMLSLKQMRYLFPDAQITFERIAGLPKSMIAIGPDRK